VRLRFRETCSSSAALTFPPSNTAINGEKIKKHPRQEASTLGIPVRGTLGLILTAKKRGVIPQARPVLENLRQSGMYLSDRILNQALKLVDE
jgi:predicted nucleic acid-binding protein